MLVDTSQNSVCDARYFAFQWPSLLLFLFLIGLGSAQTPAKAAVPEGFEFLLEPQTTQVDVFYGGRYIVSTLATYSPGEVTFSNPALIAHHIPSVIDKQRLQKALTGALNNNEYAICRDNNRDGCGKLHPEIAGVIFDESRYRIDIFVAESELSVQQLDIPKFLPPSDVGFSFIHGISAAYSSPEASSEDYSINGNTLVGFGESRLRMYSNISKKDDLEIDTLAWEKDFNGRSYQAGLLQTDNQQSEFLPTLQITGGRFASTLDTRNDLDFSEGSPLMLFLSQRSRVELYKDDRLVSSKFYEAGNQSLDTTALPSGAYNVTIRVVNGGRLIKEEERFYRKSNNLPPDDQDLFFAEAGQIMLTDPSGAFPKAIDNYLLRGGYSKRILDGFGLDGSLALAKSDSMIEIGGFYLGYFFDADASISYTKHGDQGYFLSLNTHYQNLTFSANYRKTELDSRIPDDIDDIYFLGIQEQEQGSLRVSHPIGRGRISLESRTNNSAGQNITTNLVGLSFPSLTLAPNTYFGSNFEVSEQQGLWQAMLQLSLSFSTKRWQYSASHREQRFENEDGDTHHSRTSSGNINWNDRDLLVSDVDINLHAVKDDQRKQADIAAQWESRLGRIGLSADRNDFNNGGSSQGYSAALATTILGDGEGLAIGGAENNQSAVIIDIESPDKDGIFDIIVDGGKRSYARTGTKSVINLRPFESYKVKIQDSGTALLSYDQRENSTTLYPANVKRLKYKVKKVNVVFGIAVDSDGNPIKNALIEGVEGLATTDEYGFFQAELSTTIQQLKFRTLSSECVANLPNYEVKRQVGRLGKLICKDAWQSAQGSSKP